MHMVRQLQVMLGIVLFASGCGGSSLPKPEMSKVKGTVTLDGQPLANGAIVADPADKVGLPAQGQISNGSFEFEATPGDKILRISSVKKTGDKDEYGSEITVEAVPEQYNLNTQLRETVAADGSSIWKLELTSK